MFIKDEVIAFTLEDEVQPIKIPGRTAIPLGTYNITINMSNRFKKRMPLLLDVPSWLTLRGGIVLPGATLATMVYTNGSGNRDAVQSRGEGADAVEVGRETADLDVVTQERGARGERQG